MDISKIVSVSGHSGLFEVISQIKNGIIVEALEDQKRMPVYASQKVVALDDISIYTYSEDVPLKEVFLSILDKLKGANAPDAKASADELKAFMEKVMPEYDKDRVYVSDLKKLVKWYNILNEKGYITKEEEKAEEPAEEAKEPKKKVKKAEAEEEAAATEDKKVPKKASKAKSSRKDA